jgi:FAD/FMN-containing dehydrogenase
VTFSDLVRATLKKGLVPVIVPELKTITVGGAVSGCSVESMSYERGGFHDSCLEYELVTGDGRLVRCSQDSNPEIFEMMHGSYGTLGILTKLKFRLITAKPFIHITYERLSSVEDYWSAMRHWCENGSYHYIDGIIHNSDSFIACLGKMVDEAPYLSNYEREHIYYESTEKKSEDYLNIYDYFFRYDTECHWMTETFPIMRSNPIRTLFGKYLLGSTNLIRLSKRFRHLLKLKKRPDVVVDVFIPRKNFETFLRWYIREFAFYPLWVVPYMMGKFYPWLADDYIDGFGGDRFLVDCAVYGKKNNDADVDYSEVLEKKVYELHGIKTLISRNHYDEETFWKIYDRPRYEKIKQEMDPNNVFKDLYAKVHPHRVPTRESVDHPRRKR